MQIVDLSGYGIEYVSRYNKSYYVRSSEGYGPRPKEASVFHASYCAAVAQGIVRIIH